jgi:hypothetical protein
VVGRGTASSYKGKTLDARQIGRELGVRYVVEGSVRRFKNRVRVGVRLIDTVTRGHVWAERFDRDIADLLELQDEITGRIAHALHYELTDVGRRPAERSNRPDAVDLWAVIVSQLNGPATAIRSRATSNARGAFSMRSFSKTRSAQRQANP